MNVEILGVNRMTDTNPSDIYSATAFSQMPWLQDTPEANVWALWGVTWRDTFVLDSSNRVVGVLNLTFNDLSSAANRAKMKAMFLAAANAGDTDQDLLPDHWELRFLGGLEPAPDQDPDADSYSNLLELAFGTDPADRLSFPRVNLGFTGPKQFRVSFDRWAGSPLDYLVETSTNLLDWTSSTFSIRSTVTNYCDGTGRSRATYNLVRSSSVQPSGFIRFNARPKGN